MPSHLANQIVLILLDCQGGQQAPAGAPSVYQRKKLMPKRNSTITTLLLGAAAGAMLICAPLASADDPPPCNPDDQQCQDQQNPGADIANQVIDNVQQGMDQAKQANEALNPTSNTDGLGIMVNLNGVPYCMPLNKPLPPGAVVTSPTGNGVSSWC